MIHLGDITKIHGYDIEPVDVITGGSPCQDLSVAGKRAGLAGERSGLFMEQIRIIKEMRQRDKDNGRTGVDVRPRFCIWENVPGALSSAGKGTEKGSDFQAVLEEFIHICEPEAPAPEIPEKGWPNWGVFVGDGFSLAYRIHDAQYWGKAVLTPGGDVVEFGTPQRRRRISLVLDAGGQSAYEVLFERESLSGDSGQSDSEGEGPSDGTEEGTGIPIDSGRTAKTLQIRGGKSGGGKGPLIQDDKTGSLLQAQDKTLFQPIASDLWNGTESDVNGSLQARAANNNNHSNNTVRVPVIDSRCGNAESYEYADVSHALKATHYKNPPSVGVDLHNGNIDGTVSGTLTANAETSSAHMGPKVLESVDSFDFLD